MLIPRDTSFLVTCANHDGQLVIGKLVLEHPNPDATAVWTFDFSHMRCPAFIDGDVVCNNSWEVRA